MRRFKLVKISKRRVEVQKVRFRINFGTLAVALLVAVLVWLYIAGSQAPQTPSPDTPDTQEMVVTQSATEEETLPTTEVEGSHE